MSFTTIFPFPTMFSRGFLQHYPFKSGLCGSDSQERESHQRIVNVLGDQKCLSFNSGSGELAQLFVCLELFFASERKISFFKTFPSFCLPLCISVCLLLLQNLPISVCMRVCLSLFVFFFFFFFFFVFFSPLSLSLSLSLSLCTVDLEASEHT